MSPEILTEDEARRRFVDHVNELSRDAKVHGPALDCAAQLAAIIAENEAECLRMEQEATEQDEDEVPRVSPQR